jgi:hypothetical protein
MVTDHVTQGAPGVAVEGRSSVMGDAPGRAELQPSYDFVAPARMAEPASER